MPQFLSWGEKPKQEPEKVYFRIVDHAGEPTIFACDEHGRPYPNGAIAWIDNDGGISLCKWPSFPGVEVEGDYITVRKSAIPANECKVE